MSAIQIEWAVFALFFLLLVAAVIGEVFWLVRRQWATPGRAVAYVALTDLLSLAVGTTVVLVIFFIMFMMVMGPAGRGGTAPESAYIVTTIIAIIFPPIFMLLAKRIFLGILKIRSGKAAWIYSLVITLIFVFAVILLPSLVFYLVITLWK